MRNDTESIPNSSILIPNCFSDALKYLDYLCTFGVKAGLERITAMTDALGKPQNFYRTIHVTGTNGKGSVCAMLAEILRSTGLKVGLFTSPHLESYCERIKVDGVDISENDFAEEIFRVKNCNVTGTHFEVLTAAAFDYFKRRKVDIAVVEVGLGGTWDSTNIITPEISVITNVARDHENILGDLDSIAHNKAGIIKPNIPVVTGADGQALEIIRDVAAEKNSPLYEVNALKLKAQSLQLNLRGDYQKINAAIAIETARLLGVDDEKIFSALKRVTWAGRFEIHDSLVIDGAHNPHGATALRNSLDETFPHGRRAFVFGVLGDKNFSEMIKILFRTDDFVIVTEPPSERAAKVETICALLAERKISCVAVKDNFAAVEKLFSTTADVKIIAGSLYLIGAIRKCATKLFASTIPNS
ncbi:MAG: bifunctional folylpolyglutamate synthase/dihydrofolate synthase [Selenomonadaceae bacterium]|nr:bifunctional folylpolyglutamate synthase/dihydrofolate synthase [Selenomonadaceae bacterium]